MSIHTKAGLIAVGVIILLVPVIPNWIGGALLGTAIFTKTKEEAQ